MAAPEWKRVEAHLNRTFGAKDVALKKREGVADSMEVWKGQAFLGAVYVDEEDGETSYIFEMAILDIDLEG